MTTIDQKLAKTEEKIRHLSEVRKYLNGLLEKRKLEQGRIERLHTWARQELQDVKEVEKQKPASWRRNSRFEYELALEKEQKEYEEVLKKIKGAERSIRILDFEIGILKDKIAPLHNLQEKLKRLWLSKERQLILDKKHPEIAELEKHITELELKQQLLTKCIPHISQGQAFIKETKKSFEKISSLANWKRLPENKLKKAKLDLYTINSNILALRQTLQNIQSDWNALREMVSTPLALPSLYVVYKQFDTILGNLSLFRKNLNKNARLSKYLDPAQIEIFRLLFDFDQTVLQLKEERRAVRGALKEAQNERERVIQSLLGE